AEQTAHAHGSDVLHPLPGEWGSRPWCSVSSRHAATKEGTLKPSNIQSIGLCSSLLTRDRHIGWMYEVGLDPSGLQPTWQPETITTGLEGNDYSCESTPPTNQVAKLSSTTAINVLS